MSVINQHSHITDNVVRDRYVMHVWSGDRDKTLWPNAYEYELIMPVEYRNIRRVSLLTVEMCSSAYSIDSTNNQLVVAFNNESSPTTITITPGSYTPPNMAIALEQAINASNGGAFQTVTVTYDPSTRKFSTTTTQPNGFNYMILDSETAGNANFSNNLIWDNLGFTDKTANLPLTNGSTAVIVAPNIANLKEDRFLIMEIVRPRIMTGHMNSSGDHYQPFAKIIFDTDSSINFPAQSSVYDFVSAPVEFRNIGKVDRMLFRFRRPDGRFYDFNRLEHSFTLEFITK